MALQTQNPGLRTGQEACIPTSRDAGITTNQYKVGRTFSLETTGTGVSGVRVRVDGFLA